MSVFPTVSFHAKPSGAYQDRSNASAKLEVKVLFLSHYFAPEGNAPAARTFEHAKRWVEAGLDVTIITSNPNVLAAGALPSGAK